AAGQRYAARAAAAGAATRRNDGTAFFRKALVFLRQVAVGARIRGDPARPGVLRLPAPHEDAGLLERERLAAAVQARRRRRALRLIAKRFVPASAAGREVGADALRPGSCQSLRISRWGDRFAAAVHGRPSVAGSRV